jgi:hypothetical protein
MVENPRSIEIFYCYSHRDETLRDELEKHLSILRRQGAITNWHDRRIGPGKDWEGEINWHLRNAHVVLLLISSDLLASDYCYEVEMGRALQRHEIGEARVIPVILRACLWDNSPFSHLQALPKDARPITSWVNLDEAFLDVAIGIRTAVQELSTRSNNLLSNQIQITPHVFVGTVMVNGMPAPAGTTLTASVGKSKHGSTKVGSQGRYSLQVGSGGATQVTFMVGKLPADQTADWEEGGADVLNLTVRST